MDTNIIREITEINNRINIDYRNSKLPVFIKNIIVSSRRNKLRKTIAKIEEKNYIPVKLLSDYLEVLSYTYPPFGSYRSCRKITPVDESKRLYAAVFEISIINDRSMIVSVAPISENNNLFMINYRCASHGNMLFEFTDESVDKLEIKDRLNLARDLSKQDDYQYCRDIVCNRIIRNISQYLYDVVERSERINL